MLVWECISRKEREDALKKRVEELEGAKDQLGRKVKGVESIREGQHNILKHKGYTFVTKPLESGKKSNGQFYECSQKIEKMCLCTNEAKKKTKKTKGRTYYMIQNHNHHPPAEKK